MPAESPSDPPLRYADTAVGRLAYTVEGVGPPTVLAVAGIPGSVRDYRWLAPALSPHCQVVRMDLPGYGGSPRARLTGMSTADRAAAVVALIDAIGLTHVTLLAHSSGSTPAVWVAVHRRDLVSGLVLLAPTGPRPHYPTALFGALAAAYRLPATRRAVDVLVARIFAAAGFPRSLPSSERRHAVLDAAALDFEAHAQALGRIEVPCLVCWAEDDPVIPSGIVTELCALVAGVQAVRFADGGHNVQKSQVPAIAEAVVARLAAGH